VQPPRKLPAPWSVDALESCFVVRDANGQALAYVYFDATGLIGTSAKLSRDEARRVAANIAKLPELLSGER
jgi:hypothetical protein